MTRATVITDASWCDKTRAAGWAAWVRLDGHGAPIKRFASFREPVESPTVAEILAAANGVFLAMARGATVILVQSDCMAVVQGIEGTGRKSPRLWREALATVMASGDFQIAPQITARHVRGHTAVDDPRSYVNRWCDERARTEMRAARRATNEARAARRRKQ